MSSNNDQTDEPTDGEITVSRRDALAGIGMLALSSTPGFLSFGDDNQDLGYFDTHNVKNNGEFVAQDPSPLNFGQGIQAVEAGDGGVDVTSPGSSLEQWAEDDSGTLSGPSLDTVEAIIGGREFSSGGKTINVPEDVAWADLGDALPIHYEGTVTVNVSGDHSTEEATIEAVIEAEDPGGPLIIEGDRATPSNAKVGGQMIAGALGKRPVLVRGLQFEDAHSQSDGNSALQVEGGGGTVIVSDCNFNNASANADRAITVYSGRVLTKGTIDFGTDVYSNGVVVKSQGEFVESTADSGGDTTGSVTTALFNSQNASQFVVDKSTSAFNRNDLRTTRTPITIYDGGGVNTWNEASGMSPAAHGIDSYQMKDVNFESGSGVTVSANSWHTVFSYNVNVAVAGGSIHGPSLGGVRVTWADGTTDIVANGQVGKDTGGNLFKMASLDPLQDVRKLEFENASGSSGDYGYEVRRV